MYHQNILFLFETSSVFGVAFAFFLLFSPNFQSYNPNTAGMPWTRIGLASAAWKSAQRFVMQGDRHRWATLSSSEHILSLHYCIKHQF